MPTVRLKTGGLPVYELTEAADADLQAIARYTIETWGIEQARRYEDLLENHFEAIAQQTARTRAFLKSRPELMVSRCEHHYVFHLVREKQCSLILAVFHESMDLMARVRNRLDARSSRVPEAEFSNLCNRLSDLPLNNDFAQLNRCFCRIFLDASDGFSVAGPDQRRAGGLRGGNVRAEQIYFCQS